MATRIDGTRIAFLATNGVEQSELTRPLKAARDAGAETWILSTTMGSITAWKGDAKGDVFQVQRMTADADVAEYDALVIPGGTKSPDRLRTDRDAVRLVREFIASGKPVASICHGPWMLVEADAVAGRTLTSWPSLRTDIRNAGGHWVDDEVVVDDGIVTSRNPEDLDAFCEKMLEEIAEGRHERRPPAAVGAGSGRSMEG
jgi:protease I